MKTLIEVKTGKAVDTGDVITLDGSAHILTDYDVPGLVGRGILTFSTVDTFPTDNTETVREDCEESVSSVDTGTIPVFNPQNFELKLMILNWGHNLGFKTEDEILFAASLIKHSSPVGFLGMVLREFAEVYNNEYDNLPCTMYAFDFTNNAVVEVYPHAMKYPQHVVMFDEISNLEMALEVCEELVYELCPNGE